jgi:hypothetical protein
MLRRIGLVLVILVAVVLVGAAFLRLQGAALPGLPAAPLPASLAPAIASGDSAAVASAIRARCRLLLGTPRRLCLEDFLLQLTRQGKVRLAMGALDLLGQHDASVRRRGHDYSHVIGINAWTPDQDIGAVYLQCTELFQSGCYHGVIQAYFAYSGTDSAHVVGVCRDTPGIKDNGWLHFQCVHGIGHGLVQNFTMRLPRALEGCDMLGNYFDSESCYGGAFMEFIVGGRGQSHHPHLPGAQAAAQAGGKPAGEMDHEMTGMDHGTMNHDSAPPFKVRDRSDLLYPCTVLGDRYQRACYEMQAGLIVEVTGLDFAKVAKVCDTAPELMRSVCYQGIGTYVSGVTVRDPEESIRICSLGNPRYRPWCFVGVVKNFIDVTSTPDDGIAFCRRLGARDIAASCWVAVGEQVAALYPLMDKRAEACARSAPEYVEACRFGAGLSAARPPDLPSKS